MSSMSRIASKCAYIGQCARDRYLEEGFCIFHLPKLTKDELELLPVADRQKKGGLDAVFQQSFSDLLKDLASSADGKVWDFRGFQFPLAKMSREVFPKDVRFEDAVFNQEADFSRAELKGEVDFK